MKARKPPPARLWKNRSLLITVVLPDGSTEQIRPAELRRRLVLSRTPLDVYQRFDVEAGPPSALRYVEPDPEALEEVEPPDRADEE